MFKEINIMRIFFEEPTREFNVREVSRILKMSPATASKKLNIIHKERLLKKRKLKMFDFYSADIDSQSYRDVKTYYNITKLRNSGLIEELNKVYLRPSIILFGSAAHGMDIENSDFDILVVSEKKELMKSEKFEKKLNRSIHLFVVRSVRELKNESLMNNVANGIVIEGRINGFE